MKSYAQILDEWIVEHCAPDDLLCSYKLAEDSGIPLYNCSSHLSRRSQQGYLEREARTYKARNKKAMPFVAYKVTASMLDAYFDYRERGNGGRRPVGTKVSRPRVPRPVVEL